MSNKERLFIVLNNQFNPPKEFTVGRLEFSNPVVVDEYDRNTRVTISGIPGKGYYGEVDVYYDRLQLADYVTHFDFSSLEPLTQESVVSALAIRHSIEVDPNDFVPQVFPTLADGESLDGVLVVDPNSLQWAGSVSFHLEYGKSWLDMVVGARNLDVQRHPNPVKTKRYARMMTWNVNFSAIQAALKPTNKGEYTDWPTVQTVTRALGIPDWVKGKIVDRATADVPDANPEFQRVIIQTSVTSSLLQGPVYFHYNPA